MRPLVADVIDAIRTLPGYSGITATELPKLLPADEYTDELVVKAVGESGGYGMLMGPWATRAAVDEFRDRIRADPRNYIAQPVVRLSRVPSYEPATSRIVGPLRRLTVSANRAAAVPSARRNVSAKVVMLLAAAPRQP